MAQYVVLLRHGESKGNEAGIFTSQLDLDLTAQGEKEACQAGRRMSRSRIRLDAVLSSPLKRAYRTAVLALECSGQKRTRLFNRKANKWKIKRLEELKERKYGDLTGRNKQDVMEEFGAEQVGKWRRGYRDVPPGGESLRDMRRGRLKSVFLSEIKPLLKSGKSLLIVGHSNSLRGLRLALGDGPRKHIIQERLPNGVPLVYKIKKGKIAGKFFLN